MNDLERAQARDQLAKEMLSRARNDALEDAAQICEQGYTTGSTASTLKAIAKAIRSMKDK